MRKTTLNCCPGNGCHQGCINRTHVEDGKIVKVERLTYPGGEVGDICLKGVAAGNLPYNPARLTHPLKRAGKRGEGQWERIPWEQALDEIADTLKKVIADYQPESVLWIVNGNSMPTMQTQVMLGERLRRCLGATAWFRGWGFDSGPFFAAYFAYGTSWALSTDPRALVEGKTKYILAWGCNPAEMGTRVWRYIREAQKNGARIVDVGVMADPTAKAADWWIPVSPGSDGLLALAVLGVIVDEKLYDEPYVIQYTNAPFLVRQDNGKLLRESHLSPQGSAANYVVWDEAAGQPLAVEPHGGFPAEARPALFGSHCIAGIACKPAFQLIADLSRAHPPAEVASITGASADTITRLARELATSKPATIVTGYGLRYANSGNAYRAILTLAAITGNIGVMGGGNMTLPLSKPPLTDGSRLTLNDAAVMVPPVRKRSPIVPLAQIIQGIVTGDPYPIKAAVVYGSNAVHTHPNLQRWVDDIIPNLDLIVVNDILMTATAEYADYVLPDCTLYERDDMDIGHDGYLLWLDKAIEPMHDCRPPIYFYTELGKRLGYGEYFDKTIEEWTAARLDSKDPSIAGIEPPLTFARLQEEKIVCANAPVEKNRWSAKRFYTTSGRIELYNEELLPAGDALPVFREQLESPRSALAKRYPLVFMTANNKYFVHSLFPTEPSIQKQYLRGPHLSINPHDASKRGISQGDVVSVYNDRGSFKVKVLITEAVPAGVVNVPHGWWPKQFIEGCPQLLLLPLTSLEYRDKSREIFWDLGCTKPGGDRNETLEAYSADTIFDCLCDVKKVL